LLLLLQQANTVSFMSLKPQMIRMR